MKIEIGEATRKHMIALGIEEFPFTEAELKTKYRTLLKLEHPDQSGKKSDPVIKVIEAYKHLKNLVSETVLDPLENIGAEEHPEDIFDLSEQCPSCEGRKVVARRAWVPTPGKCEICHGTGEEPIKCKFCNKGKFKTRSDRIVDCRVCKGTGIWKTIACRCLRRKSKYTLFGRPIFFFNIGHYELKSVPCIKCNGKGKVRLDPFNPVIPKGAILKPK